MADDTRINQMIETIVAHSGLDVERQEDMAEELRGHLLNLIAAKREEGLEADRAIDVAMAQFGSARAIRQALLRQRRAADLRTVLADARRTAWVPVGLSVLMAVMIAITSADVSLAGRLVGGVASAIALLFGLTLPVFAGFCWCRVQVLRAPPRGGFNPPSRVLRWTLRIGVWLTASWCIAAFTFAVGTSLFEMSGWNHSYFPSLVSHLGHELTRALLSLGAVAFLGAILAVILERFAVARMETHPE